MSEEDKEKNRAQAIVKAKNSLKGSLELNINKLNEEKRLKSKNSMNFEEAELLKQSEHDLHCCRNFNDFYTLGEKIGEGASGTVYKCFSKQNQNIYACKISRYDEEHAVQLKHNFLLNKSVKENQWVIKQVSLHLDAEKHIATVVMEYFPYPHLDKLENETMLKEIVRELLKALHLLHLHNICLRSIQPENILYDPMRHDLKIIDFAHCKKFVHRGQKKDMLTITGSSNYLAPEFLLGGGYDEKVDLWALGVTIYKLITGVTPFESEYHSDRIQNILKGKVDFTGKVWQNYSLQIQDFIEKRLLCNRQQRWSAQEAKNHHWLNVN